MEDTQQERHRPALQQLQEEEDELHEQYAVKRKPIIPSAEAFERHNQYLSSRRKRRVKQSDGQTRNLRHQPGQQLQDGTAAAREGDGVVGLGDEGDGGDGLGDAEGAAGMQHAAEVGPALGPQAPQLTEYQQRETRAHEAWENSLPYLRSMFIRMTPLMVTCKVKQRHQQMQAVQQCAAEAWRPHKCSNAAQWEGTPESGRVKQLTAEDFQQKKQAATQVTYFSSLCRHVITLPTWRCNCCQEVFEPSALHAACWPSTPTLPSMWIDLEIMQQYTILGLKEGQSCTGYLAMCQEQQDLYASLDQELEGGAYAVILGPMPTAHMFEQAWMGYLRTTTDLTSLHALGVDSREDDPLAAYPVCAGVQRPTGSTLDYNPSIAMDAVTKPSHYSKRARATKHLKQLLNVHFAAADADVQERYATGTLKPLAWACGHCAATFWDLQS